MVLCLTQSLVENLADGLALDLLAVIPAERAPHADFFKAWISEGCEAGMGYLKRREREREDVRLLMPEAKSLVVAAMVYKQDEPDVRAFKAERGFQIAQYAWGEDYHGVFKAKLEGLARRIEEGIPGSIHRAYVDTGPILERDYAALAGLGWIGKNTCLIHPKKGSYLFLGVLLSSVPTQSIAIPMKDHCGRCRACLDACPTEALREPYKLDARRCISYWTIEHKGELPAEVKAGEGTWQGFIFGCDICQAVCPWNRKAQKTTHAEFELAEYWRKVRNPADAELTLKTTFRSRSHRRPRLDF